ncbi:hypothetical protein ACE6H2_005792 [Prunus campanulata]
MSWRRLRSMAYRGRGRSGFGGVGGGFGYATQDVDLLNVKGVFDPEKKVNKGLSEEENLVNQSLERLSVFILSRPLQRIITLAELQKLDLFEKLEQRQGNNDGKEKKEGEGDYEDEEEEEEEAEQRLQ